MDVDSKEEQTSNLNELTTKGDETMLAIRSHVMDGGSLIKLCKKWDVSYSEIMLWIRDDSERSQAYDTAVNDRSEWAREVVLDELRLMSTSGLSQFYDDEGNIIPPEKWTDSMNAMVESIKMKDYAGKDGDSSSEFNIKLWNKLKAIELFGKNIGMFAEQVNVKVMRLEDIIGGSRELDDKES